MKFVTHYKLSEKYGSTTNQDGLPFSSFLFASSKKEAEALIKFRNLKETLQGTEPYISIYTERDVRNFVNIEDPDFCHTLCFVGYVALKAVYQIY
jgi:hypothetical protein